LKFTAALRYDRLNFDFENNLDKNDFYSAKDNVDNFWMLSPKLDLTG